MTFSTTRRLSFVICLSASLLIAPAWAGEEDASAVGFVRPKPTPADIRNGELSVRAYCSLCHGFDGRGGRGPDLTRGVFRWGDSDKEIFTNIKDGIPGTDMEGFGDIDDKWIWDIVSYIRDNEERPGEITVPGDKPAGKKLFEEHNCASCHWIGDRGGGRGPDLTTSYASVDYIRNAIVDPDRNVYPDDGNPRYAHHKYQRITIVTVDGAVWTGRWVNEDADYVLFLDEEDNYHTIPLSRIEEMSKPWQSQMSSFRDVLTDDQVTDLIAYVVSLRRPVREGNK